MQAVAVDVPADKEHPWLPYIGQFENDPFYDKWQAAITAYREHDAEDPHMIVESGTK
jgi:hypothetical protein